MGILGSFDPIESVADVISGIKGLLQVFKPDATDKEIGDAAVKFAALIEQAVAVGAKTAEVLSTDKVAIAGVSLDTAQASANAAPPSVLNGWRDVVGWVCAGAFTLQFVLIPGIQMLCNLFGYHPEFASPNLTELVALCFTLLGAHASTSYENVRK